MRWNVFDLTADFVIKKLGPQLHTQFATDGREVFNMIAPFYGMPTKIVYSSIHLQQLGLAKLTVVIDENRISLPCQY